MSVFKFVFFFFKHSYTCRENEVLKVQLKKYVGAVQMLKREGQTAEGEVELSMGEGMTVGWAGSRSG